jgi:REP element-mobilizing transposase RayT
MQEILQHYRGKSYLLHAYVVMPDHFHLIISPKESLERAMQNQGQAPMAEAVSTFSPNRTEK